MTLIIDKVDPSVSKTVLSPFQAPQCKYLHIRAIEMTALQEVLQPLHLVPLLFKPAKVTVHQLVLGYDHNIGASLLDQTRNWSILPTQSRLHHGSFRYIVESTSRSSQEKVLKPAIPHTGMSYYQFYTGRFFSQPSPDSISRWNYRFMIHQVVKTPALKTPTPQISNFYVTSPSSLTFKYPIHFSIIITIWSLGKHRI